MHRLIVHKVVDKASSGTYSARIWAESPDSCDDIILVSVAGFSSAEEAHHGAMYRLQMLKDTIAAMSSETRAQDDIYFFHGRTFCTELTAFLLDGDVEETFSIECLETAELAISFFRICNLAPEVSIYRYDDTGRSISVYNIEGDRTGEIRCFPDGSFRVITESENDPDELEIASSATMGMAMAVKRLADYIKEGV